MNMIRKTAVLISVLLTLVGCTSSEDSGSAALGSIATTTTTVAPTTTQPPATAAPATTRPPGTDGSMPEVVATPARGTPGTRVQISGSGFTDAQWRASTTNLWLATSLPSCALFAEAQHTVTVSPTGRLTGEFLVPARGDCRQGGASDVALTSGAYNIVFQCTACTIGRFQVTASPAATPTQCNDVGFTPNSDNLASEVMATGLPCAEAEAIVRKVGGPLGPINGAPAAEADGFRCVRTGQSDGRGLPSATYECTSGAKRITFTRT